MIVIALGANLPSPVGTPHMTLSAGLISLRRMGIGIERVSSFYCTPAWPDPGDPPFVNAVALVTTALPPAALLAALHAVEAEFGRRRERCNAPRTLDLDLIDYNGESMDGKVVLPHPRLAARAFVLIPLEEIAPTWRHPADGRPIADLVAALPDEDRASAIRLERPV
jgi:2-amino-4-hydroxy-6-hydroxymethyldihydropteridine diphosphokinase